jgi:hypothetical protein
MPEGDVALRTLLPVRSTPPKSHVPFNQFPFNQFKGTSLIRGDDNQIGRCASTSFGKSELAQTR